MIYYYYYYYLKIYCDQHINILHLLELIQRSPVRTGMFEFLFIVVALSLNLLLVTAGRVECGSMKRAESVTVWVCAPLDCPTHGVCQASPLWAVSADVFYESTSISHS